jgi:hypothetical protein
MRTVAGGTGECMRRLQRQPRLATATNTRQGQEASGASLFEGTRLRRAWVCQELSNGRDFPVATDEARQLWGKAVEPRVGHSYAETCRHMVAWIDFADIVKRNLGTNLRSSSPCFRPTAQEERQ